MEHLKLNLYFGDGLKPHHLFMVTTMAKLQTLKPRLQAAKTKAPINTMISGTNRLYGNTWQKIRQQVMLDAQYSCAVCGRASMYQMEVDHIKPLWLGGSNKLDNLQLLCKSPCHEIKTAQEAALRSAGGDFD